MMQPFEAFEIVVVDDQRLELGAHRGSFKSGETREVTVTSAW